MPRNIVIVFREDGLSVLTGGEISPAEGMNACQSAMSFFQKQIIDAAVEAGVEQRLAETEEKAGEEAP